MLMRRAVCHITRNYNSFYLYFLNKQKIVHSYYVEKNHYPSLTFRNTLQYSSNSPVKCWNCNFVYKSDLFCSNCKVLQEPSENSTYFDIIGIPKSYNVSVVEIQTKYRNLQKLLHPDKFSNKSEKEKQLSETLSSLVNEAYSTLLHPLKRGLYMLRLNNIAISEETEKMNAEFLMEIMEKNEEVENAMNDHAKIKKLVQENERVLNNLSMKVADAFHNEDIKKAESLLVQMKYYDSINIRLKKLKHDLGIVD